MISEREILTIACSRDAVGVAQHRVARTESSAIHFLRAFSLCDDAFCNINANRAAVYSAWVFDCSAVVSYHRIFNLLTSASTERPIRKAGRGSNIAIFFEEKS